MAWKVAAAIMLVQGFDPILLLAMWRAFIRNATLVMSTNFRDRVSRQGFQYENNLVIYLLFITLRLR